MSDLLISNNHVLCSTLGEIKSWYVPYYFLTLELSGRHRLAGDCPLERRVGRHSPLGQIRVHLTITLSLNLGESPSLPLASS